MQLAAGKVIDVRVRANALIVRVASENPFAERAEPYICYLLPFAMVSCTCLSFQAIGGYCKHLRAGLMKVWVAVVLCSRLYFAEPDPSWLSLPSRSFIFSVCA